MPNTNNLIPQNKRTKSEQKEIAKKGGKASGEARRERKKTREILQELVKLSAKESPLIAKLAKQCGLDNDKSIHEVVTMVLLLNTLKKGDLNDLGKLSELLGESGESAENEKNNGILDDLTKYLKKND